MVILVSDPFDPSLKERLSVFGEVTDDSSRLAEAHVLLIRSKTKCTQEYIDKAPSLKLIIRGGVGVDNIDVPHAERKGILVRNTPRASSIAVAELAFAMMIAVPNHIVKAHNSMVEGKWLKNELKRTELYGKTLCLGGIGNIATEVARRAAAFGMKVVAYDKYVKTSPCAEMKPSLEEAVKEADYISLHLPLTPETERIFGENIINACSKKPVVINTGRGPCVDGAAMTAALKDGRISWYATDVWPNDPPSEDYPVLKAPNTLMAPHIGASSKENLLRIGDETIEIMETLKKEGKI